MYSALFPWAVGLNVGSLSQAIEMAKAGGFGGVEFNPDEAATLIDQHGLQHVKQMFAEANIRPAAFGLPTDWRTSEANWQAGLEALPRQAKAAADLGCLRTMTWVLPGDNERSLEDNRRFHIERFTPIARILAEHNIRLGLEFIGPKTLRNTFKHPFLYTMEQMLELGGEIGPNVGLLLDCWHLYTSGGRVDQVKSLWEEQVVYVHVNDAPANLEVDAQQDDIRCLPGETGVIDIVGFLQALLSIGYKGPVTPEPFKKELNDLPSDLDRVQTAGKAMQTIFQRAGLTSMYK